MEIFLIVLATILCPILTLVYYDLKGRYETKMENAAKINGYWNLLEKINAQYNFEQLHNQIL